MKEFTDKELKWCIELEKVIKKMPSTIELVIGCGHADIYDYGCISRTLDSDGDMDNPDKHAKKRRSFQFNGSISGNESQI